jgi:L-2-hydroxyglutarate oxidase LhgO
MPGRDGNTYLGGEEVPEIMSPVPMMRSIVREELTRLVPAIAGGSFTLNGGIHIHAEGRVDGNMIFRELEAQARLRGFRIGRRL